MDDSNQNAILNQDLIAFKPINVNRGKAKQMNGRVVCDDGIAHSYQYTICHDNLQKELDKLNDSKVDLAQAGFLLDEILSSLLKISDVFQSIDNHADQIKQDIRATAQFVEQELLEEIKDELHTNNYPLTPDIKDALSKDIAITKNNRQVMGDSLKKRYPISF